MVAILDGISVLDFTQVLSGPTATRYLAEMGAEVTKVEAPPGGDITRTSPTTRDGRSGYFVNANRGKRSICVDLKDKRGVALILALVADVDVVVENFSPGTMERLGLGWETLSAINPRLVMGSISGFGHDGPLSHLPGYDGAAQAYAGITALNGEVGGQPVAVGAPVGDVLTGVNAATGILGALFWRERTGKGQRVETSVLEAYLQTHDTAVQSYSVSGGAISQTRNGRFHRLACPYGIFTASDGHIFIAAAGNRHWVDLCQAMDRADLLADEHPWNDRATREAARDEVNAMIDQWLASLPSRDEGLELLHRHRVPCGPVLEVDEVIDHPDLLATGAVRLASDPVLDQLHVAGFPLRFSETEAGFDNEAPHLGEHNMETLTGVAGGTEALTALIADGVVHRDATEARPSKQRTASKLGGQNGQNNS